MINEFLGQNCHLFFSKKLLIIFDVQLRNKRIEQNAIFEVKLP